MFWMLTSIFVKKWRNLNKYCGDVIRIVNMAPNEPRLAFRNNNRSKTEPNSPDNVEEDEVAQKKSH